MRFAHVFALILALASVATAADAVPADKDSFHVFVLMGQSNMAGSGQPILEEYREPATRVLTQAPDLSWSGAKTPLDQARGSGMSPGESFARHYAELHPGVTVGVIQCARGGRGIKELAKGGKDRDGAPNYDDSLKRILAAAKQGTLMGMLWHQGETDAGDAEYVTHLAALVADLRADLGEPKLPFICGELGRYAGWTSGFNSRIGAAPREIPRCAVATTEGLLDLGDKVHFSGFSAEILGARYLMEFEHLVEPELATRFAPTLADITARMLARDAGWKVILNGGMDEGVSRPFAWDGIWTGKGTLAITRDTSTSVSAPAAMRIASVGGPAQGSVGQAMRDVAGKTITVKAQAKNAGFTGCRIEVSGLDGSWKQAFSQTVIDASAARAWTAFSGSYAIPANVPNCRIAVAVDGEGAAWIDDVTVDVAETPPAPAGSNLLVNPGMTDGDAIPSAWTAVWAGTGKIASVRDTQVFKVAPAALRVESVGGTANGNVSQGLEGVAGKRVRITGWVKSDGVVATTVGLGSFDANWKSLAWETIQAVGTGAGSEWTQFDKTVAVPAGAVHVNLGMCIDGDGKAWFDEVAVSVVP